ncbi:hypothetical protein [Tuwongella immobilis]|uniref:Uncharacterized protein n=1 Tax=Tuwongella immobilis TaxID=692036 RepID=A0A6C2YRV8_9BACT|nr:hypothetical protein [Tuwongella immobilis]VIP04087.1 unnamed protein product [Tuwongella immobilis]VTS05541.1 unnamed protein product [Tuwongella immobilis]
MPDDTTPNGSSTPQAAFTGLAIIYAALMGGLLVISGMSLLLVSAGILQPEPMEPMVLWIMRGVTLIVSMVGALGVFVLIPMLVPIRLDFAKPMPLIDQLVPQMLNQRIMMAALVEAGGVIGATFHMVTGDPALLAAPVASLLLLALIFPTTDRLARQAEILARRAEEQLPE